MANHDSKRQHLLAKARALRAKGRISEAKHLEKLAAALSYDPPRRRGHWLKPKVTRGAPSDSKGGVPITVANAAAMIAHYSDLLRRTPILTKARKRYEQRLNEARKVLRRARSQGGAGGQRSGAGGRRRPDGAGRHLPGPRDVRAMLQRQKQIRAQASARGDHAAAMRADEVIEKLERRTYDETGPGAYSAENANTSEEIRSRSGEDSTDLMPIEEETPWYKRPLVWAGGLAALAAAAWLSKRKGSGSLRVMALGGGASRAGKRAKKRTARYVGFSGAPSSSAA